MWKFVLWGFRVIATIWIISWAWPDVPNDLAVVLSIILAFVMQGIDTVDRIEKELLA